MARGGVDSAEGPPRTRLAKIGRLMLLGGMPAGGVFLGKWAILAAVRSWSRLAVGVGLAISVFVAISMYLKIVIGMVGGNWTRTHPSLILILMGVNRFLLVVAAGSCL